MKAKPQRTCDVVVLGGGVIGMLTARALAAEGRKPVVVERDRLGRGASRAAGGIMSPLAPWEVDPAVHALAKVSLPMLPGLATALETDTGIDPEYRRTGVLFLDCADHEQALAYAERTGEAVRVLAPKDVANFEPAAARVEGPSVLFPDLAQVRNPRLLDALAKDLRLKGVEVLEDAGEARLETAGAGLAVVSDTHGRLAAPDVVLAAGAWSGEVAKGVGLELPVVPVRGQIIWYQAPEAGVRHVIIRDGKYVVPRQEGVVLVGSTLEEVGFDPGTTPEARSLLEAAARNVVPLLSTLPVQGHWSGLRPGAPNGVPFIGEAPGVPGLWLNTGHFRNGVNLAPGSVALLTDLMSGRKTPLDPIAYDPDRRMAPAGVSVL
ncbi:MAG: FAD-dependent oxidoreductase [Gammaproteobacteria bacterium]